MSDVIPKDERTETQQNVCDLEWVINITDGGEGDFIIQTNTPYVGRIEKEEIWNMMLIDVAVSSNGPNGNLRLHVE